MTYFLIYLCTIPFFQDIDVAKEAEDLTKINKPKKKTTGSPSEKEIKDVGNLIPYQPYEKDFKWAFEQVNFSPLFVYNSGDTIQYYGGL